MEAPDIAGAGKNVTITAISSINAKAVANTFNKQYNALEALRLDKDEESTVKILGRLADAYNIARWDKDQQVAQQIKIRFDSIVKDVRLKMNVVAFNLAKMEIPELLTK